MTAPASAAAEAHEVDLWRLIDAEGCLWIDNPDHHDAIEAALRHVEALGYSEGTHVPTAAHYAALKEAVKAVEPYLDAIICYASTIDEHDGNRVAALVRAALGQSK